MRKGSTDRHTSHCIALHSPALQGVVVIVELDPCSVVKYLNWEQNRVQPQLSKTARQFMQSAENFIIDKLFILILLLRLRCETDSALCSATLLRKVIYDYNKQIASINCR